MAKVLSKALMTHAKTTKGAFVYEKQGTNSPAITTLYLRKDGMPATPPGSITVTVTVEDGNDT